MLDTSILVKMLSYVSVLDSVYCAARIGLNPGANYLNLFPESASFVSPSTTSLDPINTGYFTLFSCVHVLIHSHVYMYMQAIGHF